MTSSRFALLCQTAVWHDGEPPPKRGYEQTGGPDLKPGMLLQLADDTLSLVGHVNENGGTCSCCRHERIVRWAWCPGFEEMTVDTESHGR